MKSQLADPAVGVVHVLDIWQAAPEFHRAPVPSLSRLGRSEVLTECGRSLAWFKSGGVYGAVGQVSLPLKHAEKFARPCKRCFGGEG